MPTVNYEEYLKKLKDLEDLADDLMKYKLAFESPHANIKVRKNPRNVLLAASDFASEEQKRVIQLTTESECSERTDN